MNFRLQMVGTLFRSRGIRQSYVVRSVALSRILAAVVVVGALLLASGDNTSHDIGAVSAQAAGIDQCALIDHIEVTQATQHDPCSDPLLYPDGCHGAPPPSAPAVDLVDGRATTVRVYLRPDPFNFTCGGGSQILLQVHDQPSGSPMSLLGQANHHGNIFFGPPWDRTWAASTANFSFAFPTTPGSTGRPIRFKVCSKPAWAMENYCDEHWYEETHTFERKTMPDIAGVGINYHGDGGPPSSNLMPGTADRLPRAVWPFTDDNTGGGGYRYIADQLQWPDDGEQFVDNSTFDSLDDWTDLSTGDASISTVGGRLRLTQNNTTSVAAAETAISIPSSLVGGAQLRLEFDAEQVGETGPTTISVEAGTASGMGGGSRALGKIETYVPGWYFSVSPIDNQLFLRFMSVAEGSIDIDNVRLTTGFNVGATFFRLGDFARTRSAQKLYGFFKGDALPDKFPVTNGGWGGGALGFGTGEGAHYLLTFAHEICHMFGMRNGEFLTADEFGWDVRDRVGVGNDDKTVDLIDITSTNTGTRFDEFWINPGAYTWNRIPPFIPPVFGWEGPPVASASMAIPIYTGDPWTIGNAFETQTSPPDSTLGAPNGRVSLLDDMGVEIYSTTFTAAAACNSPTCGPSEETSRFVDVPSLPEAKTIKLYRDGILQDTRVRSTTAPTVTIVSPLPGSVLDDTSIISWQAEDSDGDLLQTTVAYSPDGIRWYPQALRVVGTEVTLKPENLPASAVGQIRVWVSDGFNTTTADIGNLSLGPNHGPFVTIDSPVDGEVFARGDMVPLIGSAYDLEDGALNGAQLAWYSSVSGLIGTGPVLTVSGSVSPAPPLTPGVHIIELRATDFEGSISSSYVTIIRE